MKKRDGSDGGPEGTPCRRVDLELNELSDAEVSHISLVARGANRVPFRVLKREDEPMAGLDLNLLSLFPTKRKEEESAPAATKLAAILVNKSPRSEGLIEAIKAQGFEPASIDRDGMEGLVQLKFEDYDAANSVVIKMTDDIAAVFSGTVQKQLMSFPSSTRFGENIQAMSFVPGLRMASDALMETVFNVLGESETKSDLKDSMEAVLGDFSKFVSSLVERIPKAAFKLEGVRAKAKEEPAKEPDGGAKAPEGESAKKVEGDKAQGLPDLDSLMAKFESSLSSLRDSMIKSFEEQLLTVRKPIETRLKGIEERIEKVEQGAQDFDKKLKGVVGQGSSDDDVLVPSRESARKLSRRDVDAPGIFDTAFSLPGYDS